MICDIEIRIVRNSNMFLSTWVRNWTILSKHPKERQEQYCKEYDWSEESIGCVWSNDSVDHKMLDWSVCCHGNSIIAGGEDL